MNKKTTLSKFHGLMFKWRKYIKQFSYHPKHWAIISDYCMGAKNKPNDVLTFSICPYDVKQLKSFMTIIQNIMKKDIKHKNTVPEAMIDLIKNQTFFFTISYVLRTDDCVNIEYFKDSLNLYIKKSEIFCKKKQEKEELKDIKKLKRIQQYIRQNNFNHKFIKSFIYIASMLSEVMEFLAINQGAETINWISDRDPALSFKEKIFYIYANKVYNLKIGERRNNVKHILYNSFSEQGSFPLDGLIRYPDTITSALASLNFNNNQCDEKKHNILMHNAIAQNDRIIILDITSEGIGEKFFIVNK